ncbi:MAG: hypothetical protein AB1796_15440 [Bacillota bacterium]
MPDKDKQNMDELYTEIINLKKTLELAYADSKHLNQAQMLAVSRLLDEKINQYMKLDNKKIQKSGQITKYRVTANQKE